jgi:hypothetical protein
VSFARESERKALHRLKSSENGYFRVNINEVSLSPRKQIEWRNSQFAIWPLMYAMLSRSQNRLKTLYFVGAGEAERRTDLRNSLKAGNAI